jgi:hypothetical protein
MMRILINGERFAPFADYERTWRVDDIKSMSTELLNNLEADIEGDSTSNSEQPQPPSSDGSYNSVIDRLPSWREFAGGISNSISTSPQYNERAICFSSDEPFGRNRLMHLPSITHDSSALPFTNELDAIPQLPELPPHIPFQLPELPPSISAPCIKRLPLIEVTDLTTIHPNLPPAYNAAQKCDICGHVIASDIVRHKRTHDKEGRFKCLYPRSHCPHKSGHFHRQYDLKKHLLHDHFVLHSSSVKRMKNLTDKLDHVGTCHCGKRMKASEWLNHIMARDAEGSFECPDLREKTA